MEDPSKKREGLSGNTEPESQQPDVDSNIEDLRSQQNEALLSSAMIDSSIRPALDREKIYSRINNTERVQEYIAFAETIFSVLPENEKKAFCEDPINFVSQEYVFRGLTKEKYSELLKSQEYEIQGGQLGSGTGVFFSNSPFAAFDYQTKGVIAVIKRTDLKLKDDKIYEVGSDEYNEKMQNELNKFPESERSLASYSVGDIVDASERTKSKNNNERNIITRLNQPISVTEEFLVYENGTITKISRDSDTQASAAS